MYGVRACAVMTILVAVIDNTHLAFAAGPPLIRVFYYCCTAVQASHHLTASVRRVCVLVVRLSPFYMYYVSRLFGRCDHGVDVGLPGHSEVCERCTANNYNNNGSILTR